MRITPLDIKKQPFKKTMMGFDPDQVNSFLEMVANEFEQLNRSHDELAGEVNQYKQKLEHYERIEKTLNETLLTAQRATDEARLNAQKEAELILKDAQIRADRYEDQSRQRVNGLQSELLSLKAQRESFITRFRSLLKDQLSLLEVISDSLESDEGQSAKAAAKKTTRRRQMQQTGETMDEVPPQPNLSSLIDLEDETEQD
ncbi:MAG: DivIVA domain-containing protein [Chitinivibrionales bacterium]